MKIIDARSGRQMEVGQTVFYPQGESVTLLEVEPGLLEARACVRTVSSTGGRAVAWVPLEVRWTHPDFFLQHVAFLPS